MLRRHIILLVLSTLSLGAMAFQPEFAPLFSPSENEQNPRVQIVTYRKLSHALSAIPDSSANYVELNGRWRMKHFLRAADIAQRDLGRGEHIEKWSEVSVPSAWQLQGVGVATYSDKAYDFLTSAPKSSINLPRIAQSESVLYARDLTIPFDFVDRKLYLNIGAASSALTLYINGQMVGYATDSKSASEFDISSFVERGLNRVVVKVDRYSMGSWVEDGSAWRLSGINRGVFLLAQPKIRMRDMLVNTSLDPTYQNGMLQTALLLKTELLNAHTVTVYYDLYDAKGNVVDKNSKDISLDMLREDTVRFVSSLANVEKWSAERPYLYTMVYRVQREGRFTEYAAAKVGFREVEIKGNTLFINGIAPMIKGVNLEEVDALSGNVISRDKVRTDLLNMRAAGLNAIRTGGYPLPSFFYDLTDSIGFYVVNTANINAQGFKNSNERGGSLANNPVWRDVFVERVVSTYERSKRNASVVAIALGESAGNGYCMYEAYLAIKKRDPLRVVIYDGANAEWNTDIVCPLYPSIADLQRIKSRKVEQPIIAARVNADPAYWQTEGVQGAFLARWNNPTITAAGVKFDELTNNYKRIARKDGRIKLESADESVHRLHELFANVTLEVVDAAKGIVRITNHLQQTNLNQYTTTYYTVSAGKQSKATQLAIDCAPQAQVDITLPAFSPARTVEFNIGNIFKTELR